MNKSKKPQDIAMLREAIDALDLELLALLNKRAGYSLMVGNTKKTVPDTVLRPSREQEVFGNLLRNNSGPLPDEHLKAIYREILSSSRSLQKQEQVAFLGPSGTFSHLAGVNFLGRAAEFIPQPHLEAVFRAVYDRSCGLGVVPLENSLQGSVGQSLDLFMQYTVYIQAELYYRIQHSLFSLEQDFEKIHTVYSHPQPLAQCAPWLGTCLRDVTIIPTESTAAAASKALATPGSAAIGHVSLATSLGLAVLAQNIESQPDNWTRFVIIGPQRGESSEQLMQAQEVQDKKIITSLLFSITDKPGSLAAVLGLFSGAGINMRKLESRPLNGERWKYIFFADVECVLESAQYASLLEDVRLHCHSLRILGSYPMGIYIDSPSDLGNLVG